MTEPSVHSIRPVAAYLRLAGLSVAMLAVALVVGYWPTRAVAGPDGVTAMLLGGAIALLSALAGLIPPILSLQSRPRDFHNAMLMGMAVRFALTIALTVAAVFSGLLARRPLIVWIVIGYLVLLAVDTAGVVWLAKRSGRAGA
ncbi:MAG TPA: hypothetical protein VM487_15400 [Phycisphaerae bacterium]|nr:hypothetical protein [Phycisphaerae bacterium]